MSRIKHILSSLNFCRGGWIPRTGPAKAFFEVTFRCNSRCRNCDIWKRPKGKNEVTTAQAKNILKQLADSNVLHVSFSGGEPFLRNDLLELVRFSNTLSMKTSVNTNGWLIDNRVAKEICQSGLDTIYISLDGASCDVHDYIRGVSGSFERTLKAVDQIMVERLDGKPKIFINTTINRNNVKDLTRIMKLSETRRVDGVTMSVVQDFDKYKPEKEMLLGTQYLDQLNEQLQDIQSNYGYLLPHMSEYFSQFEVYLREPNQLYRYRCVAGYATVLVHPNGDVFPCPVAFEKMGNILRNSFAEIWYSEGANLLRKRIKDNQHPICWFDCMAPLNVLFSYVGKFRIDKFLNPRFLRYLKYKVLG